MQEGLFGTEFDASASRSSWTAFQGTRIHIELFFNSKERSVHISVLIFDENMRSSLTNQSICERIGNLNICFTNSISTVYV